MTSGKNRVELPSAETFWQFSLDFYPKVKPLCLYWQDQYQANVNLLLLLCYLEQQKLHIQPADIQKLADKLALFSQTYTKPLRQLRRSLAESTLNTEQQHNLKQALLTTELVAEKIEQQLLLQNSPFIFPVQGEKVLLESYASLLSLPATETLSQQIFDLRQACDN